MRDGRKARSAEESQKHISDAINKYKEQIKEPVLKKAIINSIQIQLVEYKGQKVVCFGEADECNNIAVEGWTIHPNDYEEELSIIYAEGFNTYCEAVKAIVDDLEQRLKPCRVQLEEISFI